MLGFQPAAFVAMTYIVKELNVLLQHSLPGPWVSTILLRMETVRNVVRTGGACTGQDGAHCLEGAAREAALLDTGTHRHRAGSAALRCTCCIDQLLGDCIAAFYGSPLLEAGQILDNQQVATCGYCG